MPVRSKWQSLPTEAINAVSLGIDKLAADDIVDLMLNEDRKMLEAVRRERERIAVGVEMIAAALRKGGRIVFVGAGTSGRLGILESAEMPPTFGTETRRSGRGPPQKQRGAHQRCPLRGPETAAAFHTTSPPPRGAFPHGRVGRRDWRVSIQPAG